MFLERLVKFSIYLSGLINYIYLLIFSISKLIYPRLITYPYGIPLALTTIVVCLIVLYNVYFYYKFTISIFFKFRKFCLFFIDLILEFKPYISIVLSFLLVSLNNFLLIDNILSRILKFKSYELTFYWTLFAFILYW